MERQFRIDIVRMCDFYMYVYVCFASLDIVCDEFNDYAGYLGL